MARVTKAVLKRVARQHIKSVIYKTEPGKVFKGLSPEELKIIGEELYKIGSEMSKDPIAYDQKTLMKSYFEYDPEKSKKRKPVLQG